MIDLGRMRVMNKPINIFHFCRVYYPGATPSHYPVVETRPSTSIRIHSAQRLQADSESGDSYPAAGLVSTSHLCYMTTRNTCGSAADVTAAGLQRVASCT